MTREELDDRTLGILERAYTETFGSGEHDYFVELAHEYWHRLIAQARRAIELEESIQSSAALQSELARLRSERDHYRARALGLPEPDQD